MEPTDQQGASPQIEDGHIKIANEIGEALARFNLSAYETRILWVIWRKTYGWHKKTDQISITQFQKATGLHRRHVQRTLKKLMERNIVASKGYSKIITYQFQKDYTKWKDVTSTGYPAPKEATDRSLKRCLQKHLTKASCNGGTKKEADPRVKVFLDFWSGTFQEKIGSSYSFTWKQDGALVKNLLQVYDLPELESLAHRFFNDEQQRQWGFTIGNFKKQVNRLIGLKALDPLEQAKREIARRERHGRDEG